VFSFFIWYGHPLHPEIHYHFLTFYEFWFVGTAKVTSGPASDKFCLPGSNLQLHHWRWDITSLVQSVNLIRAKKSITPIGLNIFFFASTGEPRATFLKFVFD